MDHRQAEFLKRMRLFIHDHIVGAFAPLVTSMEYGTEPSQRQAVSTPTRLSTTGRRAHVMSGSFGPYETSLPTQAERQPEFFQKHAVTREARRQVSVASVIDELQDRLTEVEAPAWESGQGGALRGQRMFGPTERRPEGPLFRGMKGRMGERMPVYEQEQALSYDDQELLIDLATILRSVAGTSKAYLGALLQAAQREMGTPFRNDEHARLKAALDWLKLVEVSFDAIQDQIEIVRERRAAGRRPRVLGERAQRRKEEREAVRREMEIAKRPLTAPLMGAIYVLDDETDEPMEKEIDDGDVFNNFAAALGGLRQAWFKIAIAMSSGPEEDRPSTAEMVAAFQNEGLPLTYEGPWKQMAGPQRAIDPRTGQPMLTHEEQVRAARAAYGEDWEQEMALRAAEEAAAKATPNAGTFGWPRAACW